MASPFSFASKQAPQSLQVQPGGGRNRTPPQPLLGGGAIGNNAASSATGSSFALPQPSEHAAPLSFAAPGPGRPLGKLSFTAISQQQQLTDNVQDVRLSRESPSLAGVLSPNGCIALFRCAPAVQRNQDTAAGTPKSEDRQVEINRLASPVSAQRRQFICNSHGTYAYIRVLYLKAFELRRQMDRQSTLMREELDMKYLEYQQAIGRLSSKYEQNLGQYVASLAEDPCSSDVEKTTADSCVALFALCHTLYFNEHMGELFVAPDYVKWLNETFQVNQPDAVQVTSSSADNDAFWSIVTRFALRNQLTAASELLLKLRDAMEGAADQRHQEHLAKVAELLEKTPVYYSFKSADRFLDEWHRWQAECANYDDELSPHTRDSGVCQRLSGVLEILRGAENAILQNADSCHEAIGALLLYSYPLAEMQKMREEMEKCTQLRTGRTALEKAIIAFLLGDIALGLRLAASVDLWLATHLVDVFVKLEFIASDDGGAPVLLSYKEYFIQEYAMFLIGEGTLWEVGLDYLDGIQHSTAFREAMVIRIPIDSELKGHKLLAACDSYRLRSAEVRICKVLARRCLKRGGYGPAIALLLRASAVSQVTKVADELFEVYLQKPSLDYRPILHSLGDKVHANVRLSFLARYLEFRDLLQDDKPKEAGKLLVIMLTSHFAPKRLWPLLFLDSLPLLELPDKLVFDVNETYELMRCLEEVVLSHRREEYLRCLQKLRGWNADEIKAQLDIFRLALARNLSRALVVVEDGVSAVGP